MEDEVRTILRQRRPPTAARCRWQRAAPSAGGKPGVCLQANRASRAGRAGASLIIGGGDRGLQKSADLIRRLDERGMAVRCILTAAAQNSSRRSRPARFRRARLHRTCSMPRSEFDVGHIGSRAIPIAIVVAPATADLMAKMAGGHADDLATRRAARDRPADPDRAGDESRRCGRMRDAAQSRAARSPMAS